MPTVVRLRLIPEEDVCLRLDRAPAQGWFLALAASYDAAWAAALHRPNERHPYAVSPLYQAGQASLWEADTIRRWLTVDRCTGGRALGLRISLADDTRAAGLLAALPHLALPHLGTAPCRLVRSPTLATDDPDILQVSWASLAAAPAAEMLRVSFETPTAVSHKGGSRAGLTAAHLLESWRDAWAWAPELERPAGLAALTPEDLWVDNADLWEDSLLIKNGWREGFVGEIEIRPRADTRRVVTALAGVADFFGTGAKTAMGMGQTRVRVGGSG